MPHKRKIYRSNQAFSLIELLVAVAILGILAAAVLFALNPIAQIQKAHDARRKSDLAEIQKALEIYYNDHNAYPTTDVAYFTIGSLNWGDLWLPYMAQIPYDPTGGPAPGGHDPGRHYQYVPYPVGSANPQGFCLYANLERDSLDPQACPYNPTDNNHRCPGIDSLPGKDEIHCGYGGQNPGSPQSCNYGVCSANEKP